MINKKIVRIFIVLTTFIISLFISSNNFYIKNGMLYLSLLLLILFFVKPIKFLKIHTPKKAIIHYLIGLIIGIILLSSVIGILVLIGHLSIKKSSYNDYYIILLISLFWIIQSFFEELVFRGLLFEKIGNLFGTEIAILSTSIIFSLFHISNNNISFLPILNIFLFGIFCSVIVRLTKNIYLVSGIHFAWNYFQGNIYGVNVSGFKIKESIYTLTYAEENNLFHGGEFGVEGGVITSILLFIAILSTIVYLFFESKKTKYFVSYYLFKSIDNVYFASLNNVEHNVNELLAINIIEKYKIKPLDTVVLECDNDITFDLNHINLTYLDRLELIDILEKNKKSFYFKNGKYITRKSLNFILLK